MIKAFLRTSEECIKSAEDFFRSTPTREVRLVVAAFSSLILFVHFIVSRHELFGDNLFVRCVDTAEAMIGKVAENFNNKYHPSIRYQIMKNKLRNFFASRSQVEYFSVCQYDSVPVIRLTVGDHDTNEYTLFLHRKMPGRSAIGSIVPMEGHTVESVSQNIRKFSIPRFYNRVPLRILGAHSLRSGNLLIEGIDAHVTI